MAGVLGPPGEHRDAAMACAGWTSSPCGLVSLPRRRSASLGEGELGSVLIGRAALLEAALRRRRACFLRGRRGMTVLRWTQPENVCPRDVWMLLE